MTEESFSPLKMLKRAQKRKKNGNGRTTRSKSKMQTSNWLEQDTKAMLTLDNTEAALKLIAEKISSKQCEKKWSKRQEENLKQEENAEYLR